MRWDKIIRAKCSPVETANNPLVCPTDEPPPTVICPDLDVCCADPAFRAAYPDLCEGREILTLKIKPEFVIKGVLESVQYKTFLVNQSGTEIELTSGLLYAVADPNIAIIGLGSGNATTLSAGITAVTVTWQNLSASAQMQVIDGDGMEACEETNIGMHLVLDNSRSMTSQFSSGSKLEYAKRLGRRFAEEINFTKDKVGLTTFNTAGTLIAALTDDNHAVAAAVAAVSSTTQETDIASGLQNAIDHLSTQTGLTKKVIVLLTDGQSNEGDDPEALAETFKASGGLIIAVGIRSAGAAFQRLQQIANAGFFLSATPSTEDETDDLLSGLKGYFCAGNCAPLEASCGGKPALNYAGFVNWDVGGYVDLIGEGESETAYDFLPGNGLYLDMAGSGAPWLGTLTSKTAYVMAGGVQYKFSYHLAGNQRAPFTGFRVRASVGSLGNQEHVLDDALQDFTEYSLTVTGDGAAHNLKLEQVSQGNHQSYGNLLDNVKLERLDTGEVLLFDTFDNENQVCNPPPCGDFIDPIGSHHYGTYCYGYGCLEDPVPEQKEDPMPPPDVESDSPPVGWTSYKCYTASCPAGSTGSSVTACAEATSEVSQADADAKATATARANAEAGLSCTYTFGVGDLVNVHTQFSACQRADGSSHKNGFAAIGVTAEDFWNDYGFFMHVAGSPSEARNHRGELLNWEAFWLAGGQFTQLTLDHPDMMFRCGRQGGRTVSDPLPALFPADTMVVDVIKPKQAGTYELYLFGHGALDANTGKFNVRVGNVIAGVLQAGFVDYGNKETVNGPTFIQPSFLEGKQFVKFTGVIVPTANDFIIITVLKGASTDQAFVQGYQIKRTA